MSHSTEYQPAEGSPNGGKLPLEVVVLGVVSFLTDVSSEAIFAVLPMYFIGVVGGSAIGLGIMEGLADFASSSLDLVSGYLADRTGKRKWIAGIGYGLSTAAKSLLLMVASVAGVAAFRVVERLGKSIRGAPRDALLAAIAPTKRRGFAFGVHKALDKAGAVIGPLLAYLVLAHWGATAKTFFGLFCAALVPAIVATAVLGLFVKDRQVPVRQPRSLHETLAQLGSRYRLYLLATAVFSLGYFSFAFLLLKAKAVGFDVQNQALLYGLFNLVFTVVSIPIGWLGDRIGRRAIVAASYVVYACMAAGMLLASSQVAVLFMFVFYGVFYAMDEGQSKAFLSDLSTAETRATAIGAYGFITGLVYLPASLIAGALWTYNPAWTFAFAIATSLCACVLFLVTSSGRQTPALS